VDVADGRVAAASAAHRSRPVPDQTIRSQRSRLHRPDQPATTEGLRPPGAGRRAEAHLRQEMPCRDPHTAGPALWALLQRERCSFEVSVAPVDGETTWRKGVEAVAIALYRQEYGRSPTLNFGRMPMSYLMSSGNNARLVESGKRFRGGPSLVANASHIGGVAPAGKVSGDPPGATGAAMHGATGFRSTTGARHRLASGHIAAEPRRRPRARRGGPRSAHA
jgi:hypothetical protein